MTRVLLEHPRHTEAFEWVDLLSKAHIGRSKRQENSKSASVETASVRDGKYDHDNGLSPMTQRLVVIGNWRKGGCEAERCPHGSHGENAAHLGALDSVTCYPIHSSLNRAHTLAFLKKWADGAQVFQYTSLFKVGF
jgi:hypothetical protein